MNKQLCLPTILVILLILILVLSALLGTNSKKHIIKTQRAMLLMYERGIVKGQYDALHGKYHIRIINDSTCVWIDSPYGDNDTVPKDTIIIR